MKLFELRHVLDPSVANGAAIKEPAADPLDGDVALGGGPEAWDRYMYREVRHVAPRTVRMPVSDIGVVFVPSLTVLLEKEGST